MRRTADILDERAPWLATRTQARVVRACLAAREREGAVARGTCDLTAGELGDPQIHAMLGLLYERVLIHAPEDTWPDVAQHAYHATVRRNHARLRALCDIVDLFGASDIPVLVLKGMALMLRHYRSLGARGMRAIDILVPEPHLDQAFALLAASGWRADHGVNGARLTRAARVVRAWAFTHANGLRIDLHWRPFHVGDAPELTEAVWRGAERLDANGRQLQVMQAADQLLHVCVHGVHLGPHDESGCARLWTVDALTLLSSTPIDWPRFVAMAEQARMRVRAHVALSHLVLGFGAVIPPDVLSALDAQRAPAWEWRDTKLQGVSTPLAARSRVEWHYCQFRRRLLQEAVGRRAAVLAAVSYVRTYGRFRARRRLDALMLWRWPRVGADPS